MKILEETLDEFAQKEKIHLITDSHNPEVNKSMQIFKQKYVRN